MLNLVSKTNLQRLIDMFPGGKTPGFSKVYQADEMKGEK